MTVAVMMLHQHFLYLGLKMKDKLLLIQVNDVIYWKALILSQNWSESIV